MKYVLYLQQLLTTQHICIMTPEELKVIENLTSEIKELRKVLTVFASAQYAEIRCMSNDSKPTSGYVRGRMLDGLKVINELMNTL